MFRKDVAMILLSFIVICFTSFTLKDPKQNQKQTLRRIVIDAGHGGSDYGASGKYSHEKDIALAVALKLQQEINEQMPEVEVVMTRTTDVFDHVHVKANKANAAHGDLFICIHCNDATPMQHKESIGYKSYTYKRKGKKVTKKLMQYRYWTTPNPAKGTETYIWGVGKTGAKEEALKENDYLVIDSTGEKELIDFDKNDPAKMVAISLKTQQYAERSRNLALTVEDEFVKAGRISRGAKQRDEKGIWVLQAVAMPAILIETGFVSDPEEEDYLNSKDGQQEIAETIVKSLKRYKYSLDNKMIGNSNRTSTPK
jgi:N-acetylmuramoyl-L-alanine amidase